MTDPRRRTIVVVDSSPDTLDLLQAYFAGLGYTVRACGPALDAPGESLADTVCAVDPDVVIYDIDLPYASSWRAALALCFDPRVHCPFVFTTTNARIAKQLMAGVTRAAVLEKPYALQTLHAAVDNALASYTRPEPSASAGEERRHGDRRRGQRRRSE